jgi:hypothetical protein
MTEDEALGHLRNVLADSDKPTGTTPTWATGTETCGSWPMPATLVKPNVRG